ncbi:deoxyribodipyrimidine photo-lyase-related protein [Variibacter gotjawalensis]|uniref:Deoxyribodipyrimidine photo-lyase-related protein n=1 Tax=Variibacter gotjawalensis TaxID=1333996 RepID=A0A0S3Q0Z0_9BRAD|nr:cryptochrome/photolyase family protein [Variibacter gotjawalensis]NIK47665.1 deoxyribodipyrimidine photolyase-related protein [Variibacter gotjawalensis]RZS49563.1 deoxyribodipyrimidine photolyase-related protein [Variibacter gotjawalensis]BAT61825.1 deoxyribodipyrimidine photo-lyase-related protein [Variibacter gotjawalensis]
MRSLVFILGDQLSRDISSLDGFDARHDVVLMVEVADETTYVKHHKQKIALILSAMRHFAEELTRSGIAVEYVRLNDPNNTGSFSGELARATSRFKPHQIIVTEPGEWRVRRMMDDWSVDFDVPVEIRDDDRFMCSRAEFRRWAGDRKNYRMEFFYREMRRQSGLLMDDATPCGDRWNYDSENRKRLPSSERLPKRSTVEPDAITTDVLKLVAECFGDHFGDLETFGWAVTREDALCALDQFVADYLPKFGSYQDAMARDEPFVFHAVLSPYLNIGLLKPKEVCLAAERAFRAGHIPLNAAEGFIRQVLGWREFVRGVYWLEMPGYAETNALSATRPLPWFYWSGDTDMSCLSITIADTRRNAYAHHIQRLMVTGNFALLTGIRPSEIEEWYLIVYADAFDWVELPNTHGMVMFADGGMLASKPYAASGAYIDRMSDYCRGCRYNPKIKLGEGACPFNLLYWRFIAMNRAVLQHNPRMRIVYKNLDQMSGQRLQQLFREADEFLNQLDQPTPQREQQDLFSYNRQQIE